MKKRKNGPLKIGPLAHREKKPVPMSAIEIEVLLDMAAVAIQEADAIIIGAGAGMGVDSGLPDFRGNTGFWKAYPVYAKKNINFVTIANPDWFYKNPKVAWGFYGHRLNMYRETVPHNGFNILKEWGESKPFGYMVSTSNVDGHFQKAGFKPEVIEEIHGTINWLQCLDNCGIGIFPFTGGKIMIDPANCKAFGKMPHCPNCGGLARPNILMFGDGDWDASRTLDQQDSANEWLGTSLKDAPKIVVVECGAGDVIASIRRFSESMARLKDITLVRINPRDYKVPEGHIGLPMGALQALELLDQRIKSGRFQ